MYAKIENEQIVKVAGRPNWRMENGEPVTDEVLAQHGWLPVVDERPEHDERTHYAVQLPWADWPIETSRVVVAYDVVAHPFERMQSMALARINEGYSERTAILAADYPEDEQKSWPVQIKEAEIVLSGDTETPTPWIDNAAASRGISREDLATLIRAQDTAYRTYHGQLTGMRQALRDQVLAVPDDANAADALAAIDWPDEE